MDEGTQAPAQASDVTAAPAASAETQAPAAPASSTEEPKELEVVYEGKPVNPTLRQEAPSEDTPNDESGQRKPDGEGGESEQDGDQPQEEKKRGAEQRIRQLAQENKTLKTQLGDALSRTAPKFDIEKAIENGADPIEARQDAMEHDRLVEKHAEAITNLNVDLTQQANDVAADFPYMDDSNPNRSPEEAALAGQVMDMWIQAANVEMAKDPQTGAIYVTQANIPFYDFVKQMDGIRTTGQKSGEVQGQRNAERQLSAVEIPTGPAPKKDTRADASLSAAEYAAKHGLKTVGG